MTHGTRSRYQSGCDCLPCRAANASYKNSWEAGQERMVDAADVAAHITDLQTSGWTVPDIAEECGCSRQTLYNIVNGDVDTVRQSTADGVMSVRPFLRDIRLDAAPLLEAIDVAASRVGGVQTLLGPSDTRAYYRAGHRGWVSEVWADRVACRVLGMPLPLLYDYEGAA